MRFVCLLAVISLVSSPIVASSWEESAQAEFERGCYLNAGRALSEILKTEPQNTKAAQAFGRLDGLVRKKLDSSALTFSERDYLESYRLLREGRGQEAKSCWHKYLESVRRDRPLDPDPRFDEVQAFYERTAQDEATRFRVPVKHSPHLRLRKNPSSVAKRDPAEPPQRRMADRIDVSTMPARPLPTREVVAQAEKARQDGQLERSVHLYRLALQMDPSSAEIKEQIAGLEQELK